MNPIIILTGPVRSGKTTALQQWITTSSKVAGILTPVINDERFFCHIENGQTFPMNAILDEAEFLTVGKFSFSSINFKKAADILINSGDDVTNDFIVIDEIGPLELKQQLGFYDALLHLTEKKHSNYRLLIVVRENCIDDITNLLHGKEIIYCNKDELKNIH